MRILICSLYGYPSPSDIYKSGFVHQRVIGYQKAGHECIVFSMANEEKDYEYDGVRVCQGNSDKLTRVFNLFKPDILFTHFVNPNYIKWLELENIKTPQVVWIHGFDALSWKRRLFNFTMKKEFLKFIYYNIKNRSSWSNSLKNKTDIWGTVSFVFVSEWMKKIAQADLGYIFNNSSIIPNPINNEHYEFTEYDDSRRLKALFIRSFDSKKYATDTAINAITILSKSTMFNQFEFSIYGTGKLFDKQTEVLKKFPNVSLHNHFLEQKEIPSMHQKHGILLCPTRQDSQGVTMCEGMSSGLTVIASENTAIPEFMPDGCGYKANTARELAKVLEHIAANPKEAKLFARRGSEFIQKKCNYDLIIEKELNVAREMLNVRGSGN